jgi:DNA-binding LytR/AlgR family response regulator
VKHFRPHLAMTERVAQNLYMPISKGRIAIQPEDIMYLEAKVNYTIFHTTRKKIMTSFHLKFFDYALKDNPSFLRINRSYLAIYVCCYLYIIFNINYL